MCLPQQKNARLLGRFTTSEFVLYGGMNREDLEHLTASGESLTVEFKRSTGQLRRAGETLCGMLNTGGGRVLIGVTDDGAIAGQLVTDRTLREVVAMLVEFEPSARSSRALHPRWASRLASRPETASVVSDPSRWRRRHHPRSENPRPQSNHHHRGIRQGLCRSSQKGHREKASTRKRISKEEVESYAQEEKDLHHRNPI